MIRNQSLPGTFCSHNQVPVLFWDNRTLIIYKLFSHKIHNIFFIWRRSRLPFLLLRYIEIAIIKLLYSCWRKIQYDMMYDLNPNFILCYKRVQMTTRPCRLVCFIFHFFLAFFSFCRSLSLTSFLSLFFLFSSLFLFYSHLLISTLPSDFEDLP